MNKLFLTKGSLEIYKHNSNGKIVLKNDSFTTRLRYGLPTIDISSIKLFNVDLEHLINGNKSYIELINTEDNNIIKFKIEGWRNIEKLCKESLHENVRYSWLKRSKYLQFGNYKIHENDRISIYSTIEIKIIDNKISFENLAQMLSERDFLKYINDNPQLETLNIKTS